MDSSISPARRRLPAYGRELLARRRAGDHPPVIWIILGERWRREQRGFPVICLPPDPDPETIDWTPAAGAYVRLVCQYAPDWWPLVAILGELAAVAAPVDIWWRAHASAAPQRAEADWAAEHFFHDLIDPWSPALLIDYRQRRDAWDSAPLPALECAA